MKKGQKTDLICDTCQHVWTPGGWQRRREDRIKTENIFRIFFDCPKCRTSYVVYYESNAVRSLMTANGELRALLDKTKDAERREEISAQIKLNVEKIKSEQVRVIKVLQGEGEKKDG